MTTSNGSNQGRIVEQVDGQVAASNERGVKLVGEAAFRNFSRYTAEPIAPPRRGAHVRLGLDASGFVRELQVLDATPAIGSTTSTARDRSITRLAVPRAASNFLGLWGQNREDVRSDHVLVLADKWLAWVEQPVSEDEE